MIKCPIDYYEDNLIFNADKSCWALFCLEGYDYDSLSTEGKINLNWRLAHYLGGIMSEAQVFIVPVEQDLEKHYERFKRSLNQEDELYQKALMITEQTKGYLLDRKQKAVNDYKTYVCVKLQLSSDEMEMTRKAIIGFLKEPVNAIHAWMNLDTRSILLSKVERCKGMAKEWLKKQSSIMDMRKAKPKEVQWMYRHMYLRGLSKDVRLWYRDVEGKKLWEPKADVMDKKVKPWKKDIINLFEGRVTPKGHYLEVETEDGISYQTFLVITQLPDEWENPGNEWLYLLQKYNIKAEVCVHIQSVDYQRALKKVDSKKQEINGQVEHISESGESIPNELYEGALYGDLIESEIKDTRAPLLFTMLQICISADSLEEMNERVEKVKDLYRDRNIVVQRPFADQVKLFMNFIPSVAGVIKSYVMPLTTLALASSVIGVSHQLGDNEGPYIGTTGIERKNVFLALWRACLNNKSASASFIGNLGVGKSFNTNLLIALSIVYGAYGLIIDPKGERTHWVKEFKLLEGYINLITMSSGKENRGMLDPFNIYWDDMEAACELAVNMVLELCKIEYGSRQYVSLKEAVNKLKTDNRKPCMHTLTNILDHWNPSDSHYEAAKDMARLIRAEKDIGMGQLLYGYGNEKTIDLHNRLNIVQIQDLKMPEKDKPKKDYTSEEVVASVVMLALAQFAKKFALMNQNKEEKDFHVILMDESWMLGKTNQGQELYSFLVRMGRSLFTSTIFNGHSVEDVPEEIRNGITYRFCFQTTDEEEAKRMLKFLGLEVTKSNIRKIQNLRNGECMMRDEDRNIEDLRFDAVFSDFVDLFNTTPKKKGALKEVV